MNKKRSKEITLEGQISSQRRLPIELKRRFWKTSRGPNHFHRPPSERPDITQIKKFRQCEFAIRYFSPRPEKNFAKQSYSAET
jgi:hypothetical protein